MIVLYLSTRDATAQGVSVARSDAYLRLLAGVKPLVVPCCQSDPLLQHAVQSLCRNVACSSGLIRSVKR